FAAQLGGRLDVIDQGQLFLDRRSGVTVVYQPRQAVGEQQVQALTLGLSRQVIGVFAHQLLAEPEHIGVALGQDPASDQPGQYFLGLLGRRAFGREQGRQPAAGEVPADYGGDLQQLAFVGRKLIEPCAQQCGDGRRYPCRRRRLRQQVEHELGKQRV